jgi:hypothetical protein
MAWVMGTCRNPKQGWEGRRDATPPLRNRKPSSAIANGFRSKDLLQELRTMNSQSIRSALIGAALSSALALPAVHAAHPPVIEVVGPSGVVEVGGFPASVTVSLNLSLFNTNNGNCISNAIQDLSVSAQHADDTEPGEIHFNAEPVDNDPQICPAPYSFAWSVPAPGDYSLFISARHGNEDGSVTEEVEFVMVAVEWPAPPAVANAYINSEPEFKKLHGKRRGCIISEIAKLHGQQETFGARPGPYDEALIRATVDSLLGC